MQKQFYSQQDHVLKRIIDLNLKDKPKEDTPQLSAWDIAMKQRLAAELMNKMQT